MLEYFLFSFPLYEIYLCVFLIFFFFSPLLYICSWMMDTPDCSYAYLTYYTYLFTNKRALPFSSHFNTFVTICTISYHLQSFYFFILFTDQVLYHLTQERNVIVSNIQLHTNYKCIQFSSLPFPYLLFCPSLCHFDLVWSLV